MKIGHVALWTTDLAAQLTFWKSYFAGVANEKYISTNNPGFESYFITLAGEATIELMTRPGLAHTAESGNLTGWAHIAIATGSRARVDEIARRAEQDGILVGKPRTTGDGYYEAVITDPDGNLVEVVA